MIPWEHDVDLCVLEDDYPRIVQLMKQLEPTGVHLDVEIMRMMYKSWRSVFARAYVDFFLISNITDKPGW
jgi:hypothetical protein